MLRMLQRRLVVMVSRNRAAAGVPGLIGTLVMSAIAPLALADGINAFVQTNLVSDIPGLAAHTDPNLVNPWGIAFSPTSPFWISDNHTGLSTLYNGGGTPLGLVVTIPPPSGGAPPAAPTGAV